MTGRPDRLPASPAHAVVRREDRRTRASAVDPGHEITELLGREQGAVHLSARLHTLAPGASIAARRTSVEQSVFVLAGSVVLDRPGESFRLDPDDHAFVERTGAHAWRNDGTRTAEWFAVRAPLPPAGADAAWATELVVAPSIRPVRDGEVGTPRVSHLDIGDFRPIGRTEMPGYRGPNLRGFSARHLTDHQNGARHHTFFGLRLPAPPAEATGLSVRQHHHPFEELYFLREGTVDAVVLGDRLALGEGDLLWTGVGAPHGFVATGGGAAFWLEAQAPMPPLADAFLYQSDWAGYTPLAD